MPGLTDGSGARFGRFGARLRAAWAATHGFRSLWAIAVSLPLAGLAVAAEVTWLRVESETQIRLSRTVGMLNEYALRAFETQEAILIAANGRACGMNWRDIAASAELHAFLRRLDGSTPSTSGVFLVAPDGILAMSSRLPVPAPLANLSDHDYVRIHRPATATERTYVGEVTIGRATGMPVFALSQARSGMDDAADGGIIGAAFSPTYFADFYASIVENPGDVVLLARDDGAVLAMYPPPPEPVGLRLPSAGPLARILREAAVRQGTLRLAGLPADGAVRLVAFRRLDEGYPVFIAYGLNPAVLRQAWLARLPIPGIGAATAAALLLWLTGRAQASARQMREGAEQRASLEARLRRSESVAALGQLAAGVAHDFGNAVQSVASGTQLLCRQAGEPERVRQLALMIGSAAERGAALSSRMLAFARRGAGQGMVPATPLAPAAVLAETADLLGRTLGSGCRVRCVLGVPPPELLVDRAERPGGWHDRDALVACRSTGGRERLTPGSSPPESWHKQHQHREQF